jgi:hypothetical protein
MHPEISATLENAVMTALSPLPVKLENMGYDPVPGKPWARFTYRPARTESAALGAKTVEYKGYAQVDIFVPAGSGPGAADAYANAVEAALPIGMSIPVGSDGLNIISVSRMHSVEEPVWYNVPIGIFWRLHHQL